jgi:murein DD-endopeptidase MepM/ murein hydrolase activator NlpD
MYEIQLHPADIRKPVRYQFLSRRAFRLVAAGAVLLALVMAAGAALVPIGIQSLLLAGERRVLRQQNRMQRELLAQRELTLDRLQRQVDAARSRQRQMSLILGTPPTSEGPGGFPEPAPPELRVAQATAAVGQALKLDTDSKALLALADELASFASSHLELTAAVPSICPIQVGSFVLTSPFGDRVSPFTDSVDFHSGIDLAAREETPVLASGGGQVVFAGRFPLASQVRWWRYGNVVAVAHTDRFVTIYAHLAEINVRRDQRVARGEQVGTVGNTGWSTSPHLHYEVRVVTEDDEEPVPVDPRIYILNYRWKGHEELLAGGRSAPAPSFDPLPSRIAVKRAPWTNQRTSPR